MKTRFIDYIRSKQILLRHMSASCPNILFEAGKETRSCGSSENEIKIAVSPCRQNPLLTSKTIVNDKRFT